MQLINALPVVDTDNKHEQNVIPDLINNSVITGMDSEALLVAAYLFASPWSWSIPELLKLPDYLTGDLNGDFLQAFLRSWR